MQIPIGWSNREALKWACYTLLAATAFGLTLGGGLTIFYLFGASLLWVVVFLLGGLFGYAVCAIAPPPVMRLLLQIVDLLEELLSLPLAIVDRKTVEVDADQISEGVGESPIVVLKAQPYPPNELFEGYVVAVPDSDRPYLQAWDEQKRELIFTKNPGNAYPFKKTRQALQFAQICFFYNNGLSQVDIYGITVRKKN